MGGQSTSTWHINETLGAAVWDGETKIVPSLKAPGFCNAETTNGLGVLTKANDAAGFTHLLLRVRSTKPYTGFKVSFAADTLNPQFSSFKSEFNVTRHDGVWHTVAVPFENFSNDWSAYVVFELTIIIEHLSSNISNTGTLDDVTRWIRTERLTSVVRRKHPRFAPRIRIWLISLSSDFGLRVLPVSFTLRFSGFVPDMEPEDVPIRSTAVLTQNTA